MLQGGRQHFPSESCEDVGRFVGVSEFVGNHMCFMVLMLDHKQLSHCSNIRIADSPHLKAPNICAEPIGGETDNPVHAVPIAKCKCDDDDTSNPGVPSSN